jgi:hypothetical protein
MPGGINNTKDSQRVKKELLPKCYEYLNNNFHKFKQDNKIKVALELVKKDMITKLQGEGFGTSNYTQVFAGMSEGNLRSIVEMLRKSISSERSSVAPGK